uniref:Uncharacterized protein n=1 Tax=Chrysemys picta bellii TaxID=8478 RepID=A0A8C3IA06_CHRPI
MPSWEAGGLTAGEGEQAEPAWMQGRLGCAVLREARPEALRVSYAEQRKCVKPKDAMKVRLPLFSCVKKTCSLDSIEAIANGGRMCLWTSKGRKQYSYCCCCLLCST